MLAAELGDALGELYATAAQPRSNIIFKESFSYAFAGSDHAQNYANTPPAVGDGHLYSLVEGGLLAAVSYALLGGSLRASSCLLCCPFSEEALRPTGDF